ncbi:hypothetical protein BSKO_11604 [Bryopsis sp. KO-2023]|nr:hypothetical protein BSKO_11604 [Bryopsis sp. KO-2023]
MQSCCRVEGVCSSVLKARQDSAVGRHVRRGRIVMMSMFARSVHAFVKEPVFRRFPCYSTKFADGFSGNVDGATPGGGGCHASEENYVDETFLESVWIRDFALVKEQRVGFTPGLNVITGESGAGKSVLVQAFGQVLGGSTMDNCIRSPSEMAVIEANFRLSKGMSVAATQKLLDLGFPSRALKDNRENMEGLLIRREITQTPNGLRSRCFVNGAATSLRVLRDIGGFLVDVNGQNSSQLLRESSMQLTLLDRIAGTVDRASSFEKKLLKMKALEQQMDDILALGDEEERDRLQELCDRMATMKLMEGEEVDLRKSIRKMESRRNLVGQCGLVGTSLGGDGTGGGIASAIQDVTSQVRSIAAKEEQNHGDGESEDELKGDTMMEGALDALAIAADKIYDAQDLVMTYAETFQFDEFEYDEMGERLRKIEVILRDFDCSTSEEILKLAKEAEEKLERWYQMEDKQGDWAEELACVKEDVTQDGCELSKMRRAAAGKLRTAVEFCLEQLAMGSSRFDVRISWDKAYPEKSGLVIPDDLAWEVGERGQCSYRPGRKGFDNVEFLLAAGPQEPLRPLGAVASGGESSRLMLALKSAPVAMAEEDEKQPEGGVSDSGSKDGFVEIEGRDGEQVLLSLHSSERGLFDSNDRIESVTSRGAPVMVLDELDSGVGGRLGQTVGKMLKALSTSNATTTGQVVCVSHLPQVAAFAGHHIKVQKSERSDGRLVTEFVILTEPTDRAEEVADMLGVGHMAAVKLLCDAQGWPVEKIESGMDKLGDSISMHSTG